MKQSKRILALVLAAVLCMGLFGFTAFAATKDGTLMVPSFRVQATDTTGAGDSFWGGFLCAYCESGLTPEQITIDRAASFTRFGNAVASLCVQKRGAIPAMPAREEVEELLQTK